MARAVLWFSAGAEVVVWMLETGNMKPRILVVDDDAENCQALSELLTVEGFDPVAFASAEAAWSAMERGDIRPTIVVTDVRMPGLNGVALLQRITARFPGVPVILVSAFPDEQMWSEGLRSGAVDVFPKPIHGASLVRTLRELVGGSRAHSLPIDGNCDPQLTGGRNTEERLMKKIATLVLAATFTCVGIAMAAETAGTIQSIDTASSILSAGIPVDAQMGMPSQSMDGVMPKTYRTVIGLITDVDLGTRTLMLRDGEQLILPPGVAETSAPQIGEEVEIKYDVEGGQRIVHELEEPTGKID